MLQKYFIHFKMCHSCVNTCNATCEACKKWLSFFWPKNLGIFFFSVNSTTFVNILENFEGQNLLKIKLKIKLL
jgi:hypothetical protein